LTHSAKHRAARGCLKTICEESRQAQECSTVVGNSCRSTSSRSCRVKRSVADRGRRQAWSRQLGMIAAAQSSSSFIPPLGREAARVFTLNLRNRLIFKAADEEGTIENRGFLGKRKTIKKPWGYSAGKRSAHTANRKSRSFKSHLLRNLQKHDAGTVHCERGYRRKALPPLEPDGACAPGSDE